MRKKRVRGRGKPHPVEAKRGHRTGLSTAAKHQWTRLGEKERVEYLLRVRQALESAGFRPTRFQWRHKGHSYGLVKDHGDHQIHVRVYEDGVVDAEWEIHRRFLQHIWSPRPSAHREIMTIFRKHGIPTELVNEHYLPRVGATRTTFPQRRHRVAHVMGGAAGVVGSLVAVSVARMVLRRLRLRGPL